MRAVDNVLGTDGPLLVTTADALVTNTEVTEWVDGVAELEAAWHYDGTVDGILEANTLALDGLKRGRVGADLFGRKRAGPSPHRPERRTERRKGARPGVHRSGRAPGGDVRRPVTTIGAGVCLEGVEIEHSIVLPEPRSVSRAGGLKVHWWAKARGLAGTTGCRRRCACALGRGPRSS
jgi:hypothetical protein